MPVYFFHLFGGADVEADEIGAAFDDLDAAYLEGCRAALEISVDMLRERRDPGSLRFEITDEGGRLLMDLPFSEVLRPSRSAGPLVNASHAHDIPRERLQLGRELKAAIAEEIVGARELVEATRLNLQRSRQA